MMIKYLSLFILFYFALLWFCYTWLFLNILPRIIRKFQEIRFSNILDKLVYPNNLAITVMMPVYNYEKNIGFAIDAVLNNDYKNTYLIVVNDGSNDQSLRHLIKRYQLKETSKAFRHSIPSSRIRTIYQSQLHPHMLVLDKMHQQKVASAADCLNAALNICRTPLCMTIDADTVITKESIIHIIYRYLSSPHCVAVGGNIFIPDERSELHKSVQKQMPIHPTLGVQVLEYLRSFIYGHEFWSPLGGALCHSGAMTLFETERLKSLGGYDTNNFSYDAEIIMRIHEDSLRKKIPYRVHYASSAIAWSAQPKTLRGLWAQRNRWQRGLLRSLSQHASLLFNPRFKRVGLLGMPFYVLFEIFGPVIEGIAYILLICALWTGDISWRELFWLLALAWGYIYILTISALLMNYLTLNQYHYKLDILKVIWFNTLDIIFYRPFRSICAVFSTIQFLWNRCLGRPL